MPFRIWMALAIGLLALAVGLLQLKHLSARSDRDMRVWWRGRQ